MTSAQAIARLRRLAAALDRIPAASWFAEAVRAYEEGASSGQSLEAALGLTPGRGGEAWWAAERRARRDALLRDAWQQHFSAMGVVKGAAALASRAQRLRDVGWRREGRLLQPGDEALIAALQTGEPIPHARRIRDIVTAGSEI